MTDRLIAFARLCASHELPWEDGFLADFFQGFRALDQRYQAELAALDAARELLGAAKASLEPPTEITKFWRTRLNRAIKEFQAHIHSSLPTIAEEAQSREDSDGQTHTWPRR